MRHALLIRTESSPLGTFGRVATDNVFRGYSVERPRIGDHPCIPDGVYDFDLVDSPKHGRVYEAKFVEGRTHIQIHSANWAHELLGCIALGEKIEQIQEKDLSMKLGVSSSKSAIARFMEDVAGEPFQLTIMSPCLDMLG